MFGSLVEYVGDSEVSSIRLSSFLYVLASPKDEIELFRFSFSRDFSGRQVDTNQMMVFVTAIIDVSKKR